MISGGEFQVGSLMTLSRQSLFDCQKLISETLNLVYLVFWNMPKIIYLHIDATYSHTALVSANIQHFTRNDSENKQTAAVGRSKSNGHQSQ